jgi:hypothetical protein
MPRRGSRRATRRERARHTRSVALEQLEPTGGAPARPRRTRSTHRLFLLAALVLALLPVAGASARKVHKPARKPAPLPPVVVPPDLVALSQKMQTLQIHSERFALRLSLAVSHAHLPRRVEAGLQKFEFHISGEVGDAPPAATLTLSLPGHAAGARLANGIAYGYDPALARLDHGRPWLELGRGGLDRILGPGGEKFASGIGVSSLKRLLTALAGARSITELGPSTVDNQAVTGFAATVASSALEEPAPPVNGKPQGPFTPLGVGSSAAEPPGTASLELFIAPSGLPVQTRIRQREEGVTATASYDIYAVNFPLSVQPPPKAQTISERALRAIERKRQAHRKHKTRRGEHEDA